MRAFFDLTTGKDIVVDLSPKQEQTLKATIEDNLDDLDAIAFKLTKKGTGTNAVVALSAIVKMDRDLTAEERANFDKLGEAPFDLADFESCLYVADTAEQTKNLVIAGFDIGRLGLSIGASAQPSAELIRRLRRRPTLTHRWTFRMRIFRFDRVSRTAADADIR